MPESWRVAVSSSSNDYSVLLIDHSNRALWPGSGEGCCTSFHSARFPRFYCTRLLYVFRLAVPPVCKSTVCAFYDQVPDLRPQAACRSDPNK